MRTLVEHPRIALNHFGIGVSAIEEKVALFLSVDNWGIFPIAINVQILVVEARRWVVPFGDLDGLALVSDIDDIESVGAAVGVVVLWNGVQIRVGKFVVNENPIVVGCHLDIDHSSHFSIICGKKCDVVGFGNVQDFELVVG